MDPPPPLLDQQNPYSSQAPITTYPRASMPCHLLKQISMNSALLHFIEHMGCTNRNTGKPLFLPSSILQLYLYASSNTWRAYKHGISILKPSTPWHIVAVHPLRRSSQASSATIEPTELHQSNSLEHNIKHLVCMPIPCINTSTLTSFTEPHVGVAHGRRPYQIRIVPRSDLVAAADFSNRI